MDSDASRRYRDLIAIGLLVVAALYLVAALTALFTIGDGYPDGALEFADRAGLSSGLFAAPLPIASLVVATLLVTRFGEPSSNSRIVVVAALGIAAVDLVFGLITYVAQFGSDFGLGVAGMPTNRLVRGALGLALLLALGLACLFLSTALRSVSASLQSTEGVAAGPGDDVGTSSSAMWTGPGENSPHVGDSEGVSDSASQPEVSWEDLTAAQQGLPASAWSSPAETWDAPVGPLPTGWVSPSETVSSSAEDHAKADPDVAGANPHPVEPVERDDPPVERAWERRSEP